MPIEPVLIMTVKLNPRKFHAPELLVISAERELCPLPILRMKVRELLSSQFDHDQQGLKTSLRIVVRCQTFP